MRVSLLSVVLCVLCGSVVQTASAQLSVDDAMAKMKAKQEAREADRNKPASITQGQLDDLKAELAKLRAENTQLKAQLASAAATAAPAVAAVTPVGMPAVAGAVPAPAAAPAPAVINPNVPILDVQKGATHEQIHRFVSMHRDSWVITRDAVNSQSKTGTMRLTNFTKTQIQVGVEATGVRNSTAKVMQDVRMVAKKIEVQIVADVAQDLTETKYAPEQLYEDNQGHPVQPFHY